MNIGNIGQSRGSIGSIAQMDMTTEPSSLAKNLVSEKRVTEVDQEMQLLMQGINYLEILIEKNAALTQSYRGPSSVDVRSGNEKESSRMTPIAAFLQTQRHRLEQICQFIEETNSGLAV